MPQNSHVDSLLRITPLLEQGDRESASVFLNGLDHNGLLYIFEHLDDLAFQRLLIVIGRQHLADLLATLDPEDAGRSLSVAGISRIFRIFFLFRRWRAITKTKCL